jgi:hemerythrin-like domain-containing protein
MEGVNYPTGLSPNEKYYIDKTGVHIDKMNNYLFKFKDSSFEDKIYWDCNSYFFGIGTNLYPIKILEYIIK